MQFDLFDAARPLTVSEVNAEVRTLVEENYAEVSVIGEVSNYKRHTSGHVYFTLKDSQAQLRAVCFRREAKQLSFEPADGMKVVAHGRLTLYEAYGQYQLVAYKIEDAGVGELERAFRELKEKLEREGLFDPAHKQPIPAFPFRIAVVTSPTGAAVRDIVSTLGRRWPCAEVLLSPVRVQGEGAAREIEHALRRLASVSDVDVVIVGRGGGSLEDLWAFNEETVARAIFDCPIPVISAVGHETDVTISDFVADVRAATPTMAAEIAVPLVDDIVARLDGDERRLMRYIRSFLDVRKGRVQELLRSYALGQIRNRIEQYLQTHDYVVEKLLRLTRENLSTMSTRLEGMLTRLHDLDARSILSRGFALCSETESGRIIASADHAVAAREMRVTFGDGTVSSQVKEKIDDRTREQV